MISSSTSVPAGPALAGSEAGPQAHFFFWLEDSAVGSINLLVVVWVTGNLDSRILRAERSNATGV